ncbi:hypothetical protein HK102_001311 [Quaeritorhiza haematococci]|nr:hypothetical protein HK102_001311 [Quaeritorhiza haematococci]
MNGEERFAIHSPTDTKARSIADADLTNRVYAGSLSTMARLESENVKGNGTLPRMRPLLLSFHDPAVEEEYRMYFLQHFLQLWRIGVLLITLLMTALYTDWMVRNQKEALASKLFEDVYPVGCPYGMWCYKCAPDTYCGDYVAMKDFAFYVGAVLVPAALVLLISFKLPARTLKRYIHHLSVSFIATIYIVSIIVREKMMQPSTPVYASCVISIIILLTSHVLMRVSFTWAACSTLLYSISYLIANVVQISRLSSGYDSLPSGLGIKSYCICIIALFLTAGTISFLSFQTEVLIRGQFLRTFQSQRKPNTKATNQLKVLQTVGSRAANFDSPLERSVMIIKSLMADPSLHVAHLLLLSQVVNLLGSTNLLTPDLEEKTVESMDDEQMAWLFTEIAPNRKDRSKARTRAGTTASIQDPKSGTTSSAALQTTHPPMIMERATESDPIPVASWNRRSSISYVKSTTQNPESVLSLSRHVSANFKSLAESTTNSTSVLTNSPPPPLPPLPSKELGGAVGPQSGGLVLKQTGMGVEQVSGASAISPKLPRQAQLTSALTVASTATAPPPSSTTTAAAAAGAAVAAAANLVLEKLKFLPSALSSSSSAMVPPVPVHPPDHPTSLKRSASYAGARRLSIASTDHVATLLSKSHEYHWPIFEFAEATQGKPN